MATGTKAAKAEHTPTPWKSWPREDGSLITNGDGTEAVCRLIVEPRSPGQRFPALVDANARFIVRACNAHDELLAALKAIVDIANETIDGAGHRYTFDYRSPIGERARAAIVKAEGRP